MHFAGASINTILNNENAAFVILNGSLRSRENESKIPDHAFQEEEE